MDVTEQTKRSESLESLLQSLPSVLIRSSPSVRPPSQTEQAGQGSQGGIYLGEQELAQCLQSIREILKRQSPKEGAGGGEAEARLQSVVEQVLMAWHHLSCLAVGQAEISSPATLPVTAATAATTEVASTPFQWESTFLSILNDSDKDFQQQQQRQQGHQGHQAQPAQYGQRNRSSVSGVSVVRNSLIARLVQLVGEGGKGDEGSMLMDGLQCVSLASLALYLDAPQPTDTAHSQNQHQHQHEEERGQQNRGSLVVTALARQMTDFASMVWGARFLTAHLQGAILRGCFPSEYPTAQALPLLWWLKQQFRLIATTLPATPTGTEVADVNAASAPAGEGRPSKRLRAAQIHSNRTKEMKAEAMVLAASLDTCIAQPVVDAWIRRNWSAANRSVTATTEVTIEAHGGATDPAIVPPVDACWTAAPFGSMSWLGIRLHAQSPESSVQADAGEG